jgi:membrane fusion protein, multidrug efflux system
MKMMNIKPTLFVPVLICAVVAAGLLSSCGRKPAEKGTEPKLPSTPVRVATVDTRKRMATEEVVGTVRPRQTASLSAKVSGTVQQILAAPGQTVTKGQLLVQIDAKEIQARLEQAQAIRDQVSKEIDRFKKLLAENAVTPQEYDVVLSRFRVGEASVKEAETMLSYVRVAAPFDGVVTAKRAEVGDMAAPGKPLVEMEDPTALRLEADVPEALIDRIHLGEKLAVRIGTGSNMVTAAVSEIAPAADPASRTLRVKLDLASVAGLRSGQFGRVAVPVAEINALRIPAAALVERGQMELVFVVANQRAQMRLVKTGKHLGDEFEVVSGLNPGEQVVIEEASRLLDGQPVVVRP